MTNFRQYRRKQKAELRPVDKDDVDYYLQHGSLSDNNLKISISSQDIMNGSPKIGDMIARSPKNHLDQWLVAEQYFKDNFEELR